MMANMQLILLFCSVLYIDVVNSFANRTASASDAVGLESSHFNNLHPRRGRIFGESAESKFPDIPIYKGNEFKSLLHLVDSLNDNGTKQNHKKLKLGKHKDVSTDPAKRKYNVVEGSTSQPMKERKDPSHVDKEHIPTRLQNQDESIETKDHDRTIDNGQLPFWAKNKHLKKKLKDQHLFKDKELQHPKEYDAPVTGHDQNLKKVLTSKDDINLDVESGSEQHDNTAPFRDQPKVDLISSSATHNPPKNESFSSKKVKRNDLLDITRASRLWVGVGVGACSCLVIVIVMSVIYLLLRSRRGRSCKLNELSLDTSNDDKPIYIKLSQLHRPKRSPNYIVTVLDESHFSINSDDTSEEELFDLSAIQHMSPSKAAIKNNLSSAHNVTSTPKKNNFAS